MKEHVEEQNNHKSIKFSSLLFTLFSMISSLLASSCCILQLILNIFSFGCAGFAIFDKYEFHFLILTTIFLLLLVKLKGIKNSYKIIILCIVISASKRIVNMFLKDNLIKSNIFIKIKGVKCNGCALKLCSELKSLANKCSIDYLNPPIANISLEVDKKIDENIIRNRIITVNLDYKVLEIKMNNL